GFKESLDFALALSPNHLDIFPLAVLPGTILRGQAEEFALDFDREPPYLLREHPGFPVASMAAAASLAGATSVFYTQGRAVPWFLSILKPLRMKPSEFLAEFSAEFDGSVFVPPRNHRDIEALQCAHIARQYEKRGKSALIPAALDLVRYHGAWSRAFAEGEKSTLHLSYPLRKVEGMEILNLEGFYGKNSLEPCTIEIRPTNQGPLARILR
ncbi:MAG: B12-binding domain-containing radical SAM protein, partial [Rectinemataceae bacterium]|nr:B12-binding domain-containing radical SAM protein [Rectinemataceae bacterium]